MYFFENKIHGHLVYETVLIPCINIVYLFENFPDY